MWLVSPLQGGGHRFEPYFAHERENRTHVFATRSAESSLAVPHCICRDLTNAHCRVVCYLVCRVQNHTRAHCQPTPDLSRVAADVIDLHVPRAHAHSPAANTHQSLAARVERS